MNTEQTSKNIFTYLIFLIATVKYQWNVKCRKARRNKNILICTNLKHTLAGIG